jgi:hypothetical protein
MISPYYVPLREVALTGANKSICKSSINLEVETTIFDLKEVFENLSF